MNAYTEWFFALSERGADAEVHRIAEIAVSMFDPERLVASKCGAVLLCHPGVREMWATTGSVRGMWCVSLDDRRDSWPVGTVFDPYDAKKLAAVLSGHGLPVRADQDADEEIIRVRLALEDEWEPPPQQRVTEPS